MKFYLILFLTLCSVNEDWAQVLNSSNPQVQAALSNGQVEGNPLANFFQKRTPMMDILFPLIKDDDGIERQYVGAEIGSAFENKEFQMGKVFYNNQELGTVYYRLNAYNDEIELKKTNLDEEKQLALVKNNEIKIVTTNREIVMRSFKDLKNKLKEGYLSLIYSGSKYLVYKRIDKKFSEPKPAANSMVNPIPSKFTDYISYYYQKKENEGINEIPLKNKKFLKEIINENTDAIKKFMRINDSNLNNEADLLAVFRFLNGE